ncbi:MAG TPA: hypothetical protein VJV05_05430 [Pyrinomonadaceae bacterium]|nr:hypothetical protein [Pyrinomonadaceae bacterium]
MNRSFAVPDSIAIQVEDRYLDLHNDFHLARIGRNEGECEIMLVFEKESGEWVHRTDPAIFHICFNGVTHLKHSFEELDSVPAEVDEIGFKNPDDANYDWLMDEDEAEPTDHLVFRFVNDEYLRIFAKEAVIKIP